MLTKDLKTFSKFLRKEKVSIIIGVSLGLAISVASTNNLVSRNTVTAQAVDASVLDDDDLKNSMAIDISDLELVESSYVLEGINSSLQNYQGYESLADKAISDKKKYDLYIKKQKEEAKKKADEVKKKAEEAKKKAEEKEKAEANEKAKVDIDKKKKEYKNTYTATFKTTAYCTCEICCGKYSPEVTGKISHTASGTVPLEGRTVAVDPDVIPIGSVVIINGHSYIAEDTGSAVKGNVIDIYFDSHQRALEWGCQYLEVTYIVK